MKLAPSAIRLHRRARTELGDVASLAASIREVGLLHPIVVDNDNSLICGARRLAAVKLLKWDDVPVTVARNLSDVEKATKAERDENTCRKPLDPVEAVNLAERLAEFERKAAKARQVEGASKGGRTPTKPAGSSKDVAKGHKVGTGGQKSRDAVAAAIGDYSATTLRRASEVIEAAKADPSLAPVVQRMRETGKVGAASTAVKATKAKAKQAAEMKAATIRATVTESAYKEFLKRYELRSIDLLLTDPPYMTDMPDVGKFAHDWLPNALERVADTGRAYICIGPYPLELWVYLGIVHGQTRLTVANVLVWTYRNTLGPSPKLDYKSNWQAILYLRGPKAPPLDCPVMIEQFAVQDINAPDGRRGDREHAWQKPDELARRLISHSTKPGDLVVDPFAGTGTFLLAAAKLGRRAEGCDIDPAMLKIAESRGCCRA